MPRQEKLLKLFRRITKEKKERKIPEILTNSKIVITEEGEHAYQLDNGMIVITDYAAKPIEDWFDSTVEYIALCLKALSSNETQFEPHGSYPQNERIVAFPLRGNWRGWGRIEEDSADKRVFRLYSAFL